MTCTGELGRILLQPTGADAGSGHTATLTVKDATNDGFTDDQSSFYGIWDIHIFAPDFNRAAADVQLNVDLDGFALTATNGVGIQANTQGASGTEPDKAEGKGDQQGAAGAYGGTGGAIAATVSGVDVTANEATIVLNTVGGVGGSGAEGNSTGGGGTGSGGEGGDGGNGGAVTALVANSTLSQGLGLVVQSDGGNGGLGGLGKSKKTALGGQGGSGGDGGNVGLTVTDLKIKDATTGIAVQSRAGKGGDGGSVDRSNKKGTGGNGGTGGGGGGIELSNTSTDGSTGTLEIEISSGQGILAESIAGNGGKGGEAHTGGSGGQGGTGGGVTVDIRQADNGDLASITATDDRGFGIVARSYGGAGGDGGSGKRGGAGAGSGPAGGVNVSYVGSIGTDGAMSDGILAQSVGGFSGNAGDASGIVAYGASSESAGKASGVNVEYDGAGGPGITTSGNDSDGIFAQSQGGGGGKASTTTGLVSLSGDASGSSGGDGGALGLTASGKITTTGARSRGVVAQSIGGTGGDGGSARGVVSIGGTGSNGGSGSGISVTSTADITTSGEDSVAVLLQSIGGGGGSAGSSVGITAIGGDGGSGATGGVVAAQVGGQIATSGTGADGLLAQSIGGSGGQGGSAFTASAAFSLSIAGEGGTGGTGGRVQLSTDQGSSVSTKGDNARGLAAMSVGGGGGHGGNAISVEANFSPTVAVAIGGSGGAAGDGGNVSLTPLGSVTTAGDNATGVSALSVGGSGGTAGTTVAAAASLGAVNLSVGGDGGGGGSAGLVDVCRGGDLSDGTCQIADDAGEIQTTGHSAVGLFAGSVGGGGGQSGATVSGSAVSGTNIAIGGTNKNASAGGRGGDVTVQSAGGITTSGDASGALVATSVGGSGGDARAVGSVGALGQGGLNIGIGGSGGSALGSGDVTVASADTIVTKGKVSPGIEASSRGGSGGSGAGVFSGEGVSGGSGNVSVGGAGGGGGVSGDVGVTWTGATLSTGDDHSPGIFAQSLAGSGGNAGLTFSGEGAGLAGAEVAVGTQGGKGGTAGDVTVSSAGVITTQGGSSDGIVAVSQGGNGGRGGMAITGAGFSQGNAAVTLGGGGGTGGTAGAVSVSTAAGSAITTNTDTSVGINALSIGGNGGHGGLAVEASANAQVVQDVPAGSATLTFGGNGGTGGTSGKVHVDNHATILTQDLNSHGIQAQSIAGSGGAGGLAVSGTVDTRATTRADANVVIGGDGGKGAVAGDAQVDNAAAIATTGGYSNGILAQSVGGSGGAGGMTYNILTNVQPGSTTALHFGVSIGGNGNTGGAGGLAQVNNSSQITTGGTSSSGIYAQSIGGNGGSGGFGGTGIYDFGAQDASPQNSSLTVNLNATVGGSGGGGALGGDVDVVNLSGGDLSTTGTGAYGIFAQSIGGNGGDGGLAANFSQSIAGVPGSPPDESPVQPDSPNNPEKKTGVSVAFTLKLGGNGGSGSDGGEVTVRNDATITTAGSTAHGVISQSIGGGGGIGGGAATNADSFVTRQIGSITGQTIQRLRSVYNASNLTSDFGTINLAIGGNGGAGGNGGDVKLSNTGQITTTGTNAYGLFGQSVGGGGGSGGEAAGITDTYALQIGGDGAAAGHGGLVDINNTSPVSTAGSGSAAIFAQSIGGGGGNTGSKSGFSALYLATLAVGGKNGAAGNGGEVSVNTSRSTISTASEQSPGIFAQSVGGGGGTHFGGAGTLQDTATVNVTVGGSSQANGHGGAVSVSSASDISTGPTTSTDVNAASIGIFAQSVGGGGGYSGSLIFGDHERIGASVQSSSADASGNGGPVMVTSTGSITTRGDNSVGIFAQSVGGGGGVQGTIDKSSTDASYIGSFGGKGSAGTVTVSHSGDQIQTTGAGAHGIFAQYASGKNSSPANPSTVTVVADGSIHATGPGARGIQVENYGPSAGTSNITIGAGAVVQGGSQPIYSNALDGAGVYIHSDRDSTLNNAGTINAKSGVAIHSFGGGVLTLNNTGTITGSVTGLQSTTQDALVTDQASGSIVVENREGGVLDAGEQLQVSRLNNWGQINVGQADTVSATHVTGDLQHNAGRLRFDIDMSRNETDVLTLDGEARLRGAIEVNVLQAGDHPSGAHNLKIVDAAGGVDVTVLDVIPSVVANYRLTSPSDTELHLAYDVDYANDTLVQDLDGGQVALTTYFDSLYQIGALDDDLAEALLGVSSAQDYARLLNTLSPEVTTTNGVSALDRTLSFANTLFSCPTQSQGNVWFDDGQCGYLTLGGSRLDRSAVDGASGFAADGVRIGAGGQMRLEGGWALGAALAYDTTNLTTDAGASSDGNGFSGGLSVKRFVENWEFGAAVYAGTGQFDNARRVGAEIASGKQDQTRTGAELRAGYVMDRGNWFIKPRLDLGAAHFGSSSYSETGSGAALAIDNASETLSYLRPAVEVGGALATQDGSDIRLNAVFSVTQFLGDPSFDATARFVNAPGTVAPFAWQTDVDSTQFDMSAGITMRAANGVSYELSAFGHLTDNQQGYGGQLRVNIPF